MPPPEKCEASCIQEFLGFSSVRGSGAITHIQEHGAHLLHPLLQTTPESEMFQIM